MRFKRIAAVSASILLLLSGCGKKLTEGEVCDKQFTEAHSQVVMMPIVTTNGKTTTTTLIPYVRYHPDTYSVSIKDFQNEKWVTEVYYVSKEVYDAVSIGDIFKYEKGRDLEEAPYTQKKQ